eukprot:364161-Chlamydomonas_euryale.AAC.7
MAGACKHPHASTKSQTGQRCMTRTAPRASPHRTLHPETKLRVKTRPTRGLAPPIPTRPICGLPPSPRPATKRTRQGSRSLNSLSM